MKKRIPIIAVAVIAAGLLVWKFAAKHDFYYAGTIEATEIDISPRLSSVISELDVKEGDDVSAGQVMIKLDGEDQKLAEALAQKDFDRTEKLFKDGAASQESYDNAKYKRDDTALRLGWCTIKSPVKGRVLAKYHEAGEWVTPGVKLLTVADLSEMWAYFYVPQTAVAKLSVGTEVAGYLPELGMRRFDGKITRINDEAEFTPKNVQTREERTRLVYGVKITFINGNGMLKPGMTLEVKLPE